MISSIWIQNVAQDINLPPLDGRVCKATTAAIESDIKNVIELSLKLQKRAKRPVMTVDDINLALTLLHGEQLYGLQRPSVGITVTDKGKITAEQEDTKIDLATYLKSPLGVSLPHVPSAHTHWLAVDGVQPNIPENPEVVFYDSAADISGLPREMAFFYTRVTTAVLSGQSESIQTVCSLLRDDRGLQELCGYFCRFLFVHIRRNLSTVSALMALVRMAEALLNNPFLNLEACLHQLLPSLMSCVVSAKVGGEAGAIDVVQSGARGSEQGASWGITHFDLRSYASTVVCLVVDKYSEKFPDLLPRVCRTYLEVSRTHLTSIPLSLHSSWTQAVTLDGSQTAPAGGGRSKVCLGTLYGGIVGLSCLGERVISEVLLPNFDAILLSISAVTSAPADASQCDDDETEGQEISTDISSGLIQKRKRRRADMSTLDADNDGDTRLDMRGGHSTGLNSTGYGGGMGMGLNGPITSRYLSPSTATAASLHHHSSPWSGDGVSSQDAWMCKSVLLKVLGWYMIKSSLAPQSLRPDTATTRRCNATQGNDDGSCAGAGGWREFVDENGEQLVPYYLVTSREALLDFGRDQTKNESKNEEESRGEHFFTFLN